MKATSEALRLTARLISNCRIVVRVNVGLRSFVAVPVPIIRCRLRLQFHKKKFSSFFRAVARVKMSLINFLNVISLSKNQTSFHSIDQFHQQEIIGTLVGMANSNHRIGLPRWYLGTLIQRRSYKLQDFYLNNVFVNHDFKPN